MRFSKIHIEREVFACMMKDECGESSRSPHEDLYISSLKGVRLLTDSGSVMRFTPVVRFNIISPHSITRRGVSLRPACRRRCSRTGTRLLPFRPPWT